MLPVPGVVRRLAPALAAAVVAAVPLLPAAALAQEPAGSTVVGELVRAWPEAEHHEVAEGTTDEAAEQPMTWVETADGDSVRIPTEDAGGLAVGSTVEVTVGDEVADPLTEEGIAPAREVLGAEVVALPDPVRTVTNEVTDALVAPRGVARDAVRPEQVAAVVDGPVARFWKEQTGGAVDLHVADTSDWVDTTVGCGKPAELWDQAAAAVGFTPGPGKHLLLYLSTAAPDTCAYGLAEVGAQPGSGGRAYVRDVRASLIAHELGHNFGLGHSSALHCADGPESGGCRTAVYRDHYDVMGASWEQVGSLNAVQAASLGTLAPSARRTLLADGSSAEVLLAPLSGTDGVRAVRLVGHDGRQFWLELRTPAGQDHWLGTAADRFGLEAGVLVRRLGDWPNTSLLLDPTPTAGRQGDSRTAVPVGTTLRLAGGFAVTVTAMDAAGATLAIASAAAASDPGPDVAEHGTGAPDVLEGGGLPGSGAVAPTETGSTAAPVAEERPDAAGFPIAGRPEPAEDGGEAQPAEGAARADGAGQALADPAEPAVAPASHSRSFVPVAAGVVLGGAAVLVAGQLVRTRARR